MTETDETIAKAVQQALENANPGAKVEVTPAKREVIEVPAHVAANTLKLLERVQMTGPEAIAWVEAVQILQRIAAPFLAAQGGPGVQFQGLGK